MPELPEVQTIVSDLNKKVVGYTIVDFWSEWKKSVKMPMAGFRKEIIGRKILQIKRRAKNILIYLSGEKDSKKEKPLIMLVHLKMTGHLLLKAETKKQSKFFNEKVNQYIRHKWLLEKEGKKISLEFSDLRKFGKIKLFKEGELENDKDLKKLGIEPLEKEFTLERFREILGKKKKSSIRNVLMDQSLIAGIGNIYASEILFEAGILPGRIVSGIKPNEARKLYEMIKKVLNKSIKMRGTSDSDYRDTNGMPGGFQKVLKVYNREGEKCKRCGCHGLIRREKMNQRSAYYCESCQK